MGFHSFFLYSSVKKIEENFDVISERSSRCEVPFKYFPLSETKQTFCTINPLTWRPNDEGLKGE